MARCHLLVNNHLPRVPVHFPESLSRSRSGSARPGGRPESGALAVDTQQERRRLTAEERHAGILDAATRVFAEKGYEGACVASIACAAGVSEALIYKHFASKRELFVAAIRKTTDGIVEQFRLAAATAVTPADIHHAIFKARSEAEHSHIAPNTAPGRPSHFFMRAHAMLDDPEIAAAMRDVQFRVIEAAVEAFRPVQQKGQIRADIDLEAIAWLFGAIFQSRDYRIAVLDPDELADVDLRMIGQLVQLMTPCDGAESGGGA